MTDPSAEEDAKENMSSVIAEYQNLARKIKEVFPLDLVHTEKSKSLT